MTDNMLDTFELRVFAIAGRVVQRGEQEDLLSIEGTVVSIESIPGVIRDRILRIEFRVPPQYLGRTFPLEVVVFDADGKVVFEPAVLEILIHARGLEQLGEVRHLVSLGLDGFAVPSPFLYFRLTVAGQQLATLRVGFRER